MGQRHQAFIIARVVPHGSSTNQAKYRCIAAYHHQWCYGTLPLQALRRFLTLAKQPDNAEVIRAEVRAIHGKYGRRGEKPKIVDAPCPFVATLLGEAWTTGGMGEPDNEDPPHSSGITFKWSLLEADMGMWDGDNNDGITIIDVTDPAAPAYCFYKDMGGRCLSAEGYVRSYYPVPSEESLQDPRERSEEEEVLSTIGALDDEKLITDNMLVEAWGRKKPLSSDDAQAIVPISIPALADISLEAVLTHGVHGGDMTELEKLLWHPGKVEQIRALLRRLSPFPGHAVPILAKTLTEASKTVPLYCLDLSEFDLADEQVLQLLSSLPADTQAKLEALNLSFNSRITCDAIEQILALKSLPVLNRLVLIGCPSIPELALSRLLSTAPRLFYKLDALLHPLTLSVREPPVFPAAFTYVAYFGRMMPTIRGITLPVFTPTRLLQNLLDFFMTIKQGRLGSFSMGIGMSAQSVFSGKRRPGQRWGERSVVSVPVVNPDALMGNQEGWLCLYVDEYYSNEVNRFAFIRRRAKPARSETASGWAAGEKEQEADSATSDSAGAADARTSEQGDAQQAFDLEILDVHGFVEALVAEGRPAPPEELVTRVANLLANKSGEKEEVAKKDLIGHLQADVESSSAGRDPSANADVDESEPSASANESTIPSMNVKVDFQLMEEAYILKIVKEAKRLRMYMR